MGTSNLSASLLVRDHVAVGACVVVLALPHLLAGPQLFADDWVWVRNGEVLGWWDVGATRLVSRPGEYGLFALLFGLGGARPLLHAIVVLALRLAASLSVLHALGRLMPQRTATTATLVWVVAPSHLTLELWASTAQAWTAIAALSLGAALVGRWSAGQGRLWPALVLLGLAGSFYEIVTLSIPVVAALFDRAVTGRWRIRAFVYGGLAAVPAVAWGVGTGSVYGEGVRRTTDLWVEHLAAPLGLGIPITERAVAGIVVVAALAVAYVLALRVHQNRSTGSAGAALSALAVAVAGAAPGLLAYTPPIGMGDRLTTVSGIGSAVFWVLACRELCPPLSAAARWGAIAALVGVAVAIRIDAFAEWIDLEDDTVREVAVLSRAALVSRPDPLVVEGPLVEGDLFYGLYDGWNATAAVQVDTGELDLVVLVDVRCLRTGPRPDEPLEQDQERPAISLPGCRGGRALTGNR